MTYFNETAALAMNRSLVPFFSFINCDANATVLPLIATNTTMNTTRNATSVDAFDLAASLGAQGVILYSAREEVSGASLRGAALASRRMARS